MKTTAPTRAPLTPLPRAAFRFTLPPGIGELNINLAGIWAEPISPGDPIIVMWRLLSARSLGLFPDMVSAKIFLQSTNVLLYSSGLVPLVAANGDSFYYTTNDQAANIISPDQATTNQLYAIPGQLLRVEITSQKTGEVFTNTNTLEVDPRTLVEWDWTGAQGTVDTDLSPTPDAPTFVINHPYQLLGSIKNIAKYRGIGVMGSLTILETPDGSGASPTEVQSFQFSLAGPGEHDDFVSQNITKNWTWIIPGVWVDNPTAPWSKTYDYSVSVNYSDSFGNVYPTVVLGQYFYVTSSVTWAKWGYGLGALAALGAGLIAGIFSFGIGTAIGTALAAGLGVQALDPPEPDPRYKERVPLPRNENNGKDPGVADARFAAMKTFLDSVSAAVDLMDVLAVIQNRLLGARDSNDKKSIRLQRQSYSEALSLLDSTGVHVGANAQATIESVKAEKAFDSNAISQTIRRWQRYGIPTSIRRELMDQGCTIQCLRNLRRGLNEPSVARMAENFEQAIGLIAFSVLNGIAALKTSAPSILR